MRSRSITFGMSLCILVFATVFAQSPPAPANLTATFEIPAPISHGNVRLQWQMPAAGQWLFNVYRSVQDTTHYQQIGTGLRDQIFRDFAVMPGNRYYYYVRAYALNNPQVLSPRSNVASIVIPTTITPVHGFISGTVIDDSTGLPLRRVRMRFFRLSNIGSFRPDVLTDSLGRYRAVLDTGRYIVKAEAMCASNVFCYYPEYFDNVREPNLATIITVGDSTNFTANFGLTRVVPPTYATMRGTVKDTLNRPLLRARVSVMRTMQNMASVVANGGTFGNEENLVLEGVGYTMGVVWSGYTDSLGRYTAHLISGRDYIVMASKEGFWPEYYDNKPTPQLADIIHFTRDTSGIDFSLSVRPVPQNSVAGRVRDSLGNGVPARVYLYPIRMPVPSIHPIRYGHTDSLGNYVINNVEAGKYFVSAYPFRGFAPAYYKANACGVNRREHADTVHVTGNVTNINICVRPILANGLARISGTVRTSAQAVLRGVAITAETQEGVLVGFGISDPAGSYVIEAVTSGAITLAAERDGYNVATTNINISPSIFSVDNVNIAMSPSGLTAVDDKQAPRVFALEQNFPNPFNPSTQIKFHLPQAGFTTLEVFNLLGQKVGTLVNENLQANSYTFTFDAHGLASGIYFYKLRSGSFVDTKKMIFAK